MFLKHFLKSYYTSASVCNSNVRKRREKQFYFSDKNSTRNTLFYFIFWWINLQNCIDEKKNSFLKNFQFRTLIMQIALIDYVIMIATMWSQLFSLFQLPFGFKSVENKKRETYFTPPFSLPFCQVHLTRSCAV